MKCVPFFPISPLLNERRKGFCGGDSRTLLMSGTVKALQTEIFPFPTIGRVRSSVTSAPDHSLILSLMVASQNLHEKTRKKAPQA